MIFNKYSLSMLLLGAMCLTQANADTLTKPDMLNFVTNAEYITEYKPSGAKLDSILAVLPTVNPIEALPLVDDSDPKMVIRIVNAIYLTDNLRKGYELEEARDALAFTSRFPFRRPNGHDYRKLTDIINSGNAVVQRAFLGNLPFTLRNSGALPEVIQMRGLIESKVADCKEKQDALKLIDDYAPLSTGAPAPQPTLYDKDGKPHTFADYKGKTVVIDVWATWCHNCLKKMPDYHALRDSYPAGTPVEFLSVSIDRRDSHDKWLTVAQKHSIDGPGSLIVNSDATSEFEQIYKVFGVPRYIVIGPDGNMVEGFAPSPGPELKKIIDATL